MLRSYRAAPEYFGYYCSHELTSRCRQKLVRPTIIGAKRQRLQDDPDCGAQKRPRRTGSPAGAISQTPTSCTTRNTQATEPDTGFDRGDDDSGEASPHGTERSLVYYATPAETGVSVQVHADLVLEVNHLHETLDQTQSALEAMQKRLQMLEQHQTRIKGQSDVLIRMMQPAAPSSFSARTPPRHVVRIPIWLEHANVEHGMCEQIVWQV